MSIRVQCPGCDAEYALADHLAGKKVRCKECDGVIDVRAEAPPETALRVEPPRTATGAACPDRPAGSPRAAPRRKWRRGSAADQKKRRGEWLILGGAGGALLLMLACGGVGLFFLIGAASTRRRPRPLFLPRPSPRNSRPRSPILPSTRPTSARVWSLSAASCPASALCPVPASW